MAQQDQAHKILPTTLHHQSTCRVPLRTVRSTSTPAEASMKSCAIPRLLPATRSSPHPVATTRTARTSARPRLIVRASATSMALAPTTVDIRLAVARAMALRLPSYFRNALSMSLPASRRSAQAFPAQSRRMRSRLRHCRSLMYNRLLALSLLALYLPSPWAQYQ